MREYGIADEESDIRVHVSPLAKTFYVFKTSDIKKLIKENSYEIKEAYQPNVPEPTAIGYLVPIEKVPNLKAIHLPEAKIWAMFGKKDNLSTSKKGELATRAVLAMLSKGKFPLEIMAKSEEDIDLQISGTDIHIRLDLKIQVKCDWLAASKENGGTGNFYIQKDEINPLGNI